MEDSSEVPNSADDSSNSPNSTDDSSIDPLPTINDISNSPNSADDSSNTPNSANDSSNIPTSVEVPASADEPKSKDNCKAWLNVEVVVLCVLITGVWSLLSLPVIVYHIPISEVREANSILDRTLSRYYLLFSVMFSYGGSHSIF